MSVEAMLLPADRKTSLCSPRDRVRTTLMHREPDRVPVDFLAAPQVYDGLISSLAISAPLPTDSDLFDPQREAVLQYFDVDCRVVSYDMFCAPPDSLLPPGAVVDWWGSMNRSTPARMWRARERDGSLRDIWGTHAAIIPNPTGAYESFIDWPLADATSLEDLKSYRWPEPDWWDFRPLPELLRRLDANGECHIRFRIGSVFEVAWQLCRMDKFLIDLAMEPALACYIMDRLTDVLVENTRRVLGLAGERIDMVYFYDDVATQNSLMISREMWRELVRPRHARLIEVAQKFAKPVMYHCDGALAPLIPDLIDMGVDVLNPVQPGAKGMDFAWLKETFGDRLAFHGGIDIVNTLPRGTVEDVRAEVRERVRVLGKGGGYIMAGSHHFQPDTPLANIRAMYEPELRVIEHDQTG